MKHFQRSCNMFFSGTKVTHTFYSNFELFYKKKSENEKNTPTTLLKKTLLHGTQRLHKHGTTIFFQMDTNFCHLINTISISILYPKMKKGS